MPNLNFLHLIFQGFPETIAFATFVFVFSNQRLEWKNIIFVSIIQMLTTYLIRMLPMTFGIHTIILIITLAIYVKAVTGVSFSTVLKVSALGMVVLAVVEIIVDLTLFEVLKLSVEQANSNTILWILIGWPQVIVLFLLAWLKESRRKKEEPVRF